MSAPYEKLQPHIPLIRVENVDDVNRELIKCYLCHGLLWSPVACPNCEKTFCSKCIQAFHKDKATKDCPHGCSTYIEGKCPKAITDILIDREVSCCYKLDGCTEVILYNELEKHEQTCDYQSLLCNGCQQEIIKKNFDQHQRECPLILIQCDQCLTSFKREANDTHTHTECLRLQLQQEKSKVDQLKKQVVNQQTKIDRMEQKLQQNDSFWAGFFGTINELKSMLNTQNVSTTN